ncbi:class D beta-lactamase [Massilia forsythiae]|uniref:Class D beta-lactamase n=1 Tax=Massilia forsythiae TaxID=2728020 RepID=A0A7Z2ZUT3_9BURK|nr:M56 family metallopeptidase [Massilia forsythiae]QJE02754.1 class D beta-lactamase [Massilia forsythiae]
MSGIDLFALRFGLAALASLGAGLGVWALATIGMRLLPTLALQRSAWLLGQLTVAAAFASVLLPHGDGLRMVPAIAIDELAGMPAGAPAAPAPASAPAAAALAAPATPPATPAWPVLAARAWCAAYLLGLAHAAWRLARGQRLLARLAGAGRRLAPGGSPACLHDGVAVIEVDAPVSPMLLGPFKPRLLLPLHLRAFEPLQQQLIVAHELTHLRRGDLHWSAACVLLQALFWFNPAMRVLGAGLVQAQELGCDRDVLRGRPPAQRKAYAMALLAQLRLQHPANAAGLAFGAGAAGMSGDMLGARMALIRDPARARHGRLRSAGARAAAVAALAVLLGAGLMLQPALDGDAGPAPGSAPARAGAHTGMNLSTGTSTGTAAAAPLHCIELVDAASARPLLRQGQCDTRITPASTFNIAVSLMGFDAGILRDEHTPRLPYAPGYADWNASWRASTDPTSWIGNSNVWYAQRVVEGIGAAAVQRYVDGFGYGNRDLSGDHAGADGKLPAWVGSTLQISATEQAAFLRKVVRRELPLQPRAYEMTARLLRLPGLVDGWTVHGKTGTASPRRADGSEDPGHAYGWFVGWASKDGRDVVFAELALVPTQEGSYAGPRVRDDFLRRLPARLRAL